MLQSKVLVLIAFLKDGAERSGRLATLNELEGREYMPTRMCAKAKTANYSQLTIFSPEAPSVANV